MMTEYRLDVKDTSDPQSRLVFLKRLEVFLKGLMDSDVIQGYALSTPYSSTTIFKVKEEAEG